MLEAEHRAIGRRGNSAPIHYRQLDGQPEYGVVANLPVGAPSRPALLSSLCYAASVQATTGAARQRSAGRPRFCTRGQPSAKLERNARTVASANLCSSNSSTRRPKARPAAGSGPSRSVPSCSRLPAEFEVASSVGTTSPTRCLHEKASRVTSPWLRTARTAPRQSGEEHGQFSGRP